VFGNAANAELRPEKRLKNKGNTSWFPVSSRRINDESHRACWAWHGFFRSNDVPLILFKSIADIAVPFRWREAGQAGAPSRRARASATVACH
jgi:hypothetical protein